MIFWRLDSVNPHTKDFGVGVKLYVIQKIQKDLTNISRLIPSYIILFIGSQNIL